ncbi:MliC family protein [Microbulbifer sp. YPW16]|uniref:MliC family protein n=1 Tax=Microbulbifer sp. YPW16 TaxID=2904242 RepID=UPI001E416B48|nr:MliC family protein [Microbulbifer sp. YPW16]UHQ53831.1 MliC family protein [Microbulbifer sp. YPW16]
MNRAIAAMSACLTLLVGACDRGSHIMRGEVDSLMYLCDQGAELAVRYLTPSQGPATATLTYDNKLITMHQEPAASGVLFVADKGYPDYRWHTKGQEGMLVLYSSNDKDGNVLLGGCTTPD